MLKRNLASVLRFSTFGCDALTEAKKSGPLLRKELDELDLDKINDSNFFKVT
jgi:hypothetical protein